MLYKELYVVLTLMRNYDKELVMRFLDRLGNSTGKAPTLESIQHLQEKRNAARAARRKKTRERRRPTKK